MDKEILRIVIIVTGLIVVVGMVAWSMLKKNHSGRRFHLKDKRNPLNNIDPSLALHPEYDEFDIIPLDSSLDADNEEQISTQDYSSSEETAFYDEPKIELKGHDNGHEASEDVNRMPALIQFSLVAIADEGFNGADLADAFDALGLKYGNIKIYEKLDANGLVDFGVASMVEPGIFPDTDLDSFNCPGLVFFMQPGEVDHPRAVFDDFIRTIDRLAHTLGGTPWDHQKNPLTDQTIAEFRSLLH